MKEKPINRVRKGTYITLLEWMRTKYGLMGDKLIIYAIIHSFSQDGISEFRGSTSYLRFWTGKSKKTTLIQLKELYDAKLIDRRNIPISALNPDKHYVNYWSTFSRLDPDRQNEIISKNKKQDEKEV